MNKTLIILGMALVHENKELYREIYSQLTSEVIEEKFIQKYDDMVKFKNTKIRHMLQYLLICSFIVF
jgi:uncharacterized protein YutE (UPF0331/DUF86 family)